MDANPLMLTEPSWQHPRSRMDKDEIDATGLRWANDSTRLDPGNLRRVREYRPIRSE